MSTQQYRMAWIFGISLVLTIAFQAEGQTAGKSSLTSKSVVDRNRSLRRLSPELAEHTQRLQRALSRYLTSGDSFTPYLRSNHFWLELRKSRVGATLPKHDPNERRVLWRAYSELERDIVQIMLADQLGLYQRELDLNEFQFERIDGVLRRDAEKKIKLLLVPDSQFLPDLTDVSTATEKQIMKLLFPEQIRIYNKRQTQLRDIWTG